MVEGISEINGSATEIWLLKISRECPNRLKVQLPLMGQALPIYLEQPWTIQNQYGFDRKWLCAEQQCGSPQIPVLWNNCLPSWHAGKAGNTETYCPIPWRKNKTKNQKTASTPISVQLLRNLDALVIVSNGEGITDLMQLIFRMSQLLTLAAHWTSGSHLQEIHS